jgi:hypothetical protein
MLCGNSRVDISMGKTSVHDWQRLFRRSNSVFHGPCHLTKGDTMIWDFSFIFPTHVDEMHRKSKEDHMWTGGEKIELPPSALLSTWTDYANNKYEVYAVAKKSTFFSINVRKSKELIFRRRGNASTIAEQSKVLDKTIPLNISTANNKFTRILHKVIASFGEPDMKMTIRAQVPARMDIEKPANLRLQYIHVEKQPPSNLAVPEVRIRKVRHEVRRKTWARVRFGESTGLIASSAGTRKFYSTPEIQQILTEGAAVDLSDDLRVVLEELEETSSFRSALVSRLHNSKTIVYLDVGGSRRRVVFRTPFLLLPRREESGAEAGEKTCT